MFLLTSISAQAQKFSFPAHLNKNEYVAGQLIAKLKPEFASLAFQTQNPSAELITLMSRAGITDVRKNFPSAGKPETQQLDLYLNFFFDANADLHAKSTLTGAFGTFRTCAAALCEQAHGHPKRSTRWSTIPPCTHQNIRSLGH
jgi:hypothetical protein